jgi:PAS domain S-box-containing protein
MAAKPTSAPAHQPSDLSSLCLAITEHAPLPMATVEGASHMVRYVNPAFCRLMDKPMKQFVGKPFCEMLPKKDECVALLDRVFRTGKPESHTEQEHSKPPVFWSYTVWPVLTDERIVGVIIQVTDTIKFHEKTVAMNEALLLGSVRQHERTEASDNLNAQLRTEITERKQAEQRVRTSEIRYRRLFEAAQGGILILDPKTRKITEANPYIIELLGYPREQLLGKELWEIGLLKDKKASQKAFLELKAKGFIRYESLPLETKADQRREVEFVSNLYQENGEAVIQCNIRDVTDRKKVEQELSEKARLLDLSNDAIIVHDLDDKISSWNKGAEDLYGWTSEEVIGKHLDSLLQMEFPKPLEEIVAQLQSEGHFSGEVVQIARDGRRVRSLCRWVLDRGTKSILTSYTDITERKQAEEALLKAGALQSAIFNSANFSSIATDAKGVIQIFNVGAERMLGYTAAGVMNKVTPADISDPQELIARATALSVELGTKITPGFEALVFKASRGIEDIYELTYIRKDGSRFPAVVSVTALRDAQDAIIGYLLIGTDNTARKQAEEALVKAGALQSAIFNSANFSSIATDAKGVIQIFNVGAERMLGYTAAEVMNKITPADISDPQEVVARAKALSAELETPITPGFEALVFKASRGIEDIYELTYIRKDGSRFPAVVSVTALRDAQDAIIGYLLIGTDNTARKQVEEERQKLDQRLRDQQFYTRSLIESNIDALMTTDPSSIITDVNKQMEALTGCTRDELIGSPFKNYFTDSERAEAAIKLVLSEKKLTNYELTTRARDGKETVVSYNATTFYDRDRKLQGVFAAARDVTERKQAERAITEVRDYAESIIRTARDPIMVLGAGLRVVSVSEAFLQTFKLAQSETEGRLVYEVGNGEWNIPRLRELLEEILPRNRFFNNFEVTHDFESIGQRTMLLNARTLRESSGQPAKILLGIEDITERKQTEEALRESETRVRALFESAEAARLSAEAAKTRAEAATRAKDDFLAALSHELRTPLNPALLLATSLADDAALPPRVREDIDVIARGIALQAQLVDDMLDITRITTGKLRLDLQPIDAHSVLRQVYEILRTDVQERQIDVTLDLAAPHNCIKADAVRVQQIFWNVLKNAVKFTPPGGAITVRTRNPADKEGMLAVEITDTGIGIEPGILGKVFDAFIQEEHDGAHRFGGLGLGLAITRRLVEAQHGQIHAESAGRGHGATFRIELPLEEPGLREAEGLAPIRPTAGVAAARCILLVEDHEPTRSTLVQLLERRGHKVVGVTTAAAAREIAAARDCDLVISDLGLPDGDGHALMAELRDAYGLPGIALSGYGMEEDLESSLRSGFFTHLTKPVDIHALESAIAIAPQTRSAL